MTITLMNTSASRCRLLLRSRRLSSTLAAVAKEKEILLKLKEIIDPVSEKSIGIGIIQVLNSSVIQCSCMNIAYVIFYRVFECSKRVLYPSIWISWFRVIPSRMM